MSERKFKDGDRVVVSQTPVDGSDKRYSGQAGTVVELTHRNDDMDVYNVLLDGDDYKHAFYDQDLLQHDGLEVLRAELAEAEAKVATLKEAIRLKERNAAELPIATVVSYKDTYGSAAITKQGENVWLNVYPTQSGNPKTEHLEDQRVTRFLCDREDALVRKP